MIFAILMILFVLLKALAVVIFLRSILGWKISDNDSMFSIKWTWGILLLCSEHLSLVTQKTIPRIMNNDTHDDETKTAKGYDDRRKGDIRNILFFKEKKKWKGSNLENHAKNSSSIFNYRMQLVMQRKYLKWLAFIPSKISCRIKIQPQRPFINGICNNYLYLLFHRNCKFIVVLKYFCDRKK